MNAFVSSFHAVGRSAFAGAALTAPRSQSRPTVTMVASKAVPFLEAPPKLDGTLAGDEGFDPLYLSNYIDLDYARAGELKNGRIAMLATIGILVQEFIHLPGPMFQESNPIKAIYAVPVEGWIQILAFIAVIELATFKTTFESGADYGFDPLGLGKKGDRKDLEYKELVNARLAMIAFLGFIVQTISTGKPIVAQLTSF